MVFAGVRWLRFLSLCCANRSNAGVARAERTLALKIFETTPADCPTVAGRHESPKPVEASRRMAGWRDLASGDLNRYRCSGRSQMKYLGGVLLAIGVAATGCGAETQATPPEAPQAPSPTTRPGNERTVANSANAPKPAPECAKEKTRCGEACVDLLNDADNCGTCGSACPVGCSSGKCRTVVELLLGGAHACARMSDGAVFCWGSNTYGQLGHERGDQCGTGRCSSTAYAVAGLTDAVQLALGDSHTCARTGEGKVKCWGRNRQGALGYDPSSKCTQGTGAVASTFGCEKAPREVPGLTGVAEIAAGDDHTCARLTSGTVKCWGSNGFGQLGEAPSGSCAVPADHPGSPPVSCNPSPSVVVGISDVIQIDMGSTHSCAVLKGGSVKCWGQNLHGTLGFAPIKCGRDLECTPTPTLVPGVSGAIDVSVGNGTVCARAQDGTVSCWGGNVNGTAGASPRPGCQGPSDAKCFLKPTKVRGIQGARGLSVGAQHACALLADSSVNCWGANASGQLGNPTNETCQQSVPCSSTPVKLLGIGSADQVRAGGLFTCAISSGDAKCWGSNLFGELGDGSRDKRTGPVSIAWGR